jgi:hypothetical protein
MYRSPAEYALMNAQLRKKAYSRITQARRELRDFARIAATKNTSMTKNYLPSRPFIGGSVVESAYLLHAVDAA